ncbi:MAG TPA: TIGR02594 family protein [Allosphingosinicella sp.]|nr:TIGR02594 family protein [Allosphingosinicella sp.]
MSRKALFEANRPFANGYVRAGAVDTQAIAIVNQLADHLGLPATDDPSTTIPVPQGAVSGGSKKRPSPPAEPVWVRIARELIGTREVPGPRHNGLIAKGWARLGAGWFNDDETPWCGFFVAHCVQAAGLKYPKGGSFARAKAWLDWGVASAPVIGAVAVFGRIGGGHIGFVVGESATHLYVLGGNQSNAVSIAPITKRRLLGLRWPRGHSPGTIKLPRMSGGQVSRSET